MKKLLLLIFLLINLFSYSQKIDTLRVIILYSSTNNNTVEYCYGYQVKIERKLDNGYYNDEIIYLDDKKKPFLNKIIWQIRYL